MALSAAQIANVAWQEILGYLNFSSGASDPVFLGRLNELWQLVEEAGTPADRAAGEVARLLRERLDEMASSQPSFRNAEQARAVISLVFDRLLPAYREFHRDLLFHQSDGGLWRPLFVGRAIEAVLAAAGGAWENGPAIVESALKRLNDYVGYRPVPVLETHRHEPYPHERLRPIPLYIAGAGVAAGKYHELIEQTLEVLRTTDRDILEAAWFDPNLLDELALDPRAYDFNHPADRRPNHHFGQWDMHLIDNQGRYRRFVLQQTALDAIWDRVEQSGEAPREQLLAEAAAVLSGTILMASGTTGSGPETHDSSVTLGTLLPHIAAYRDEFYKRMFDKMQGTHRARLQKEAEVKQQPFAGARQHLNAQLARRRALQMQHVMLASQFARLGFAEAAMRQAQIVPAASARMVCQIQCLLTSGRHLVDQGRLDEALASVPQIEDYLQRAIQCGAIVDPWNLLGFAGQFSLFPAVENSVPDPRIEELLDLMEQLFALYSRLWNELATREGSPAVRQLQAAFHQTAEWWDGFAPEAMLGEDYVSGGEEYAAAARVAKALSAWHDAGAAAGNVAFWRPFADEFHSAQAYGSVIEVLFSKSDWQASAALLIHWLSRAFDIGLGEGSQSFYTLCVRWMQAAIHRAQQPNAAEDDIAAIPKFFDYLEANADEYWSVPAWDPDELGSSFDRAAFAGGDEEDDELDELDEDDEDDDGLFSAAYENMVYRDSTSDGIEADMLEGGGSFVDDELEMEHHRLSSHLAFLAMLAALWKMAGLASAGREPPKFARVNDWLEDARKNRLGLEALAANIQRHAIRPASAGLEALLEYDRRRMLREALLEKVIATTVATSEAELLLAASAVETGGGGSEPAPELAGIQAAAAPRILTLWRAVLAGDAATVQQQWEPFLAEIAQHPLLYVPLARGGDPRAITTTRATQFVLRELLGRLPRLGLLRETCQLLRVARAMEKNQSPGAGAVTEFDGLFEVGYQAIVESMVESSRTWNATSPKTQSGEVKSARQREREAGAADAQLIDCLQLVTESLLSEWLSHSRTLRLSVLERVLAPKSWDELVDFIKRYGHDVFTQSFLHLGNLRAILHQGVDAWIEQLEADEGNEATYQFVEDLGTKLPRSEARRHLGLIIEAVAENYPEYRDYNATTTQSDRGEMIDSLLDFLRLKVGYERIHWNLRPVIMAHEVLIRRGFDGAAELWRRAMAERTAEVADQQLKRLASLQKKYGMRLPSVADRLSEKFVRPLVVDRLRSLVRPAAEEARRGEPASVFSILEQDAGELAQEPCGAGLVAPDWLELLEEEVIDVCQAPWRDEYADSDEQAWKRLTWEEIQTQLSGWDGLSEDEE